MKCPYCDNTKIYKRPHNQEMFDKIVDIDLDKGYHVNPLIAEQKAYSRVGYDEVECPYCKKEENEGKAHNCML